MLHSITHKTSQTIRGMKIEATIKAPQGANVDAILEKFRHLYAWAEKDPNQFNLPLEGEKDAD